MLENEFFRVCGAVPIVKVDLEIFSVLTVFGGTSAVHHPPKFASRKRNDDVSACEAVLCYSLASGGC